LLRFARNDGFPTPRGKLRGVRCVLPKFSARKSWRLHRRAEHLLRFARSTLETQEAPMRFSMPSYLLGVGTVVGALTFGFGGGIFLTKTAIKDTPAGPSKIERAARPEPMPPQVQVTEAKAVPVPRADPSPALQPSPEPAPQVQAAAENPKPVVEAAKENPAKLGEPVKQPDAPKQAEQPIKQADAPKQAEQPVRHGEAKPVEQKDSDQRTAEREQRRAEQRKIDREKRIAERKARTVIIVRRQRPMEEQEQPARPELAFEREEPRPNLFEGLFGRPAGESRE
jgi:hypothetical protein